MTEKVLCIDSELKELMTLRRQIERHFTVVLAYTAEEALAQLENHTFAAVVANVRLEGSDGIALLETIASRAPDAVRIVLTGDPDPQLAIDAVNRCQAFRFLTKPCPRERLVATVRDAVERHQATCSDRIALAQTQHGCMRVLTELLASNTPEVLDRQLAVKELAGELITGLDAPDAWAIEAAAQLGRVGELGLPERLHDKARRGATLDEEEAVVFERVPEIGAKLLENLPLYQTVAEIVRYQDHRYDGGSSPSRTALKGDGLPLGARILKVARDMVDLECDGKNPRDAYQVLRQRAGHYDPDVLEALARHLRLDEEFGHNDYPPRSIPLAKLRRGDVLAAPLVSGDGRMLMQTGHRITAVTLQRIRNYTRMHGIEEPLVVEDWRKERDLRERTERGARPGRGGRATT